MKKIAILLICVFALFAVNSVFAAEQPEMSVFVADISAGETAHVSITLPGDASGSVTVSVNGHNYQANVVNGQASVDLTGLSPGNYVVNVKYNGGGNYSAIAKQANLKVADSAPAPSVNNNSSANASGEPVNTTPANASGEPVNTTPANASGEPVNVTQANNTSNSTVIVVNNVTNNSTNNTNISNNTIIKNLTVKDPKKEPPKPHKFLEDKKTGLPILLLLLVVVGVVFGLAFRKR